VGSIAAHIASVGKLPIIDALAQSGPVPSTDTASAARVRALVDRLTIVEGVVVPNGPLLLVDDTYRSGWTMTVAAAILRRSGASAVLPLVVHQLP
jgi:ATP-dependent DNA helicase RecQ